VCSQATVVKVAYLSSKLLTPLFLEISSNCPTLKYLILMDGSKEGIISKLSIFTFSEIIEKVHLFTNLMIY
jgi:hypothetical protein